MFTPSVRFTIRMTALLLGSLVAAGTSGGCGSNCSFTDPVTGTVHITAIAPSSLTQNAAVNGEPCQSVRYTWDTGGGGSYSNYDNFSATPSCLAAEGLAVGSTFSVTWQDSTGGSCSPTTRIIVGAGAALCARECESHELMHDAAAATDATDGTVADALNDAADASIDGG